ncbi:DUF6498-containing protein [Halomicroarcula sp. GCM10025710]
MRIRPESPLHSDTIAVIAGNLIPIVGVVAAGWQPETLLFVYLAELRLSACGPLSRHCSPESARIISSDER